MLSCLTTHLTRGRNGGQCASMKGVDRGDDDGEVNVEFGVSIFPCELDGSLVSFCTTVAEKGLKEKKMKVDRRLVIA